MPRSSRVQDKAFVEKYIISRGQVPAVDTPEEFAKTVTEGRAAAKEVVQESGLPPQ